jgi:hypothetical protein
MNRYLVMTTFAAALAILGLGSARAGADEHPRLHMALYELRQARIELKQARHDFGGHRKKALEALDVAISQVDKALRAVGDNIKGDPAARDVYKGYANHPHIRQAIVDAREARTELMNAAHDYRGHRAKAVEALDAVVKQLEKVLQHAR